MHQYEYGSFLNLRFPWRKRTLGELNKYTSGLNKQTKLFERIEHFKTNSLIWPIEFYEPV
jgi:hypothetical protein